MMNFKIFLEKCFESWRADVFFAFLQPIQAKPIPIIPIPLNRQKAG
jgi:hypothetical protein